MAESTGKDGRGVLPVVGEPLGERATTARTARSSRSLTPGADVDCDAPRDACDAAGHPVFRIETDAERRSAREFFRWEFATAVAGAVLGVNPFDEPNVREAKDAHAGAARRASRATGALRIDPPFDARPRATRGATHRREAAPTAARRYIAILDYLPPTRGAREPSTGCARPCGSRIGLATTHGVGPRYLHSTGQYTRADRTRASSSCSPADDRRRRRCPAPATPSAR